jgi:hypothetical protein
MKKEVVNWKRIIRLRIQIKTVETHLAMQKRALIPIPAMW